MIEMIPKSTLTARAKCAGCAAKLGAEDLLEVLKPLSLKSHPDLLVGLQTSDDAAVYRLDENQAIVQTLDFFPPIVDDPQTYGEIAAANSLSDVFAMNGTVILALSIAAFPEDLSRDVITSIFEGAARKVEEAGGVIAGGHTIIDDEPKYGLSVTGVVDPERVWTKAGARTGDVLFLTKPLGTGLITTAHKNGRVASGDLEAAVNWMSTLNRWAQEAARTLRIHACTDVTGFGLVGHAYEVATKSGVGIEISSGALPVLPGTMEYGASGNVAGGLWRNRQYYAGQNVRINENVSEVTTFVLYDPQTSGGLLLAVEKSDADELQQIFARQSLPIWRIGQVVDGEGLLIRV